MEINTNNTSSNALKFLPLRGGAKIPQRATEGSAGYDLCACLEEELEIKPGDRVLIPTGFAIGLPQNTAGMIFTRSGLGIRHGIHVSNGVGVVDWDYRGEVHVGLHNLSTDSYRVSPGERIAQLILVPVLVPKVLQVESLDETDRGTGGFGSTGK